MAAPTITETDVSVKIGNTDYAGVAGTETGDIVVHVPYLSPVVSCKIKAKASAASSFYTSDEVDTEALCSVATGTAAYLNDGAGTPTDLLFNLSAAEAPNGYEFWISAVATTKIADDTELSAYKIFIIPDLNKVVPKNSYSAALGALVTYDISKFKYVNNGIDIKADKGGLAVVGYNIKGGYIPYVEFSSGKLILYKAIGTQVDANTEIYGQVTVLKR